MKKFIREISNNILSLNRYSKRTIVIVTDIALCVLCTWFAFILRLEEFILIKDLNFYPALISIIFVIPIFWLFGLTELFLDIQDYRLYLLYRHLLHILYYIS